ncbi:hypothetical protein BC937DRAFT_87889 [Endogone sp. FLAS-F59071]|nr:hypothetical protein BC937DRAFT_87889 [Endogone sp. FLAS-F59071]|eukprot:RUS19174.1 hypothetical protein BC937DRAFT_87889 [Endogone sp. FLAS-F59071]
MTDAADCTEVLEAESKGILFALIGQLRMGMDLHRVTLPTFVLEPRSMLERITDFMVHPDLLMRSEFYRLGSGDGSNAHVTNVRLGRWGLDLALVPRSELILANAPVQRPFDRLLASSIHKADDPLQRFVDVVRYYLSGWHIKPKGVKKPYNPTLGEHFRCRYNYPDGTQAFYVAEQVSHHPPISAYHFASPENQTIVAGDLRPKSRFLGNSAATLMQGSSHIIFTNRDNERYDIVMPNVYARGILFGTMTIELGDNSTVRCEKNDLICELEFKSKGFFSGAYNSVFGKIKRESTDELLYEISGRWSDVMFIKMHRATNKNPLLDVTKAKIHPKIVAPESEQEANESRRLWSKVTTAIHKRDLSAATAEKTRIENNQRSETRAREQEGVEWKPRYFDHINDDFPFKLANISFADPKVAKHQIENFIFSKHEEGFQSPTVANGPSFR